MTEALRILGALEGMAVGAKKSAGQSYFGRLSFSVCCRVMKWSVSESSSPLHHGACDGCGAVGPLVVVCTQLRPQHVVALHFCGRRCWQDWRLRQTMSPVIGHRPDRS